MLNLEGLDLSVHSINKILFTVYNSGDLVEGKIRLCERYLSLDIKSKRRDLMVQVDEQISGLVDEYFRP